MELDLATLELLERDRVFRALASTWDVDLGGEMFAPGAFERSLEHWRRSGHPLPVLDSHLRRSVRNVIGQVMDAEETDAGLEVLAEIVDTPDGDRIIERLRLGAIDRTSVGVRILRWRAPLRYEREAGVRRVIEEAELREVSLVIWPANPGARLLAADEAPPKAWTPADRLMLRARVHAMRRRAALYS